jgi:hypothetical protein
MSTMKAVIIDKFSTSDVMKHEELDSEMVITV